MCFGGYAMFANYHTYTARCGHASGREEEYILRAIEGGIKILGFSDHIPLSIHLKIRCCICIRCRYLCDCNC